MKNEYTVIVSERAKNMLGRHIAFLAQVSKAAAREKKRELMQAMRSLCDSPQRYPFLDEPDIPKNMYRKMYVPKRYLVLYQVKDDTVYVDYILDLRQDYVL